MCCLDVRSALSYQLVEHGSNDRQVQDVADDGQAAGEGQDHGEEAAEQFQDSVCCGYVEKKVKLIFQSDDFNKAFFTINMPS